MSDWLGRLGNDAGSPAMLCGSLTATGWTPPATWSSSTLSRSNSTAVPSVGSSAPGHVESHREEYYEVEHIGLILEEHNKQLERWTDTYNTIRPHQSLDYKTLHEYY